MALAGAFGALVALLAMGIPIYLTLGLVGLGLFLLEGYSSAAMAQVVLDHLNSGSLMSVPFFIISATFMQRSGTAQALIDTANCWVGHLTGGLVLACVLAAVMFSAISGSTSATALVLGLILVPAMVERGYKQHFSLGVVGASGILGTLIPPSLALIIYGLIADTSIPKLFLAGVVPGLLLSVMLVLWSLVYCKVFTQVPPTPPPPLRETLRTTLRALPALMIPVLALGGIYSGLITIVEAAALACILSILVGWGFYRQCTARDLVPILAEGMRRSTVILLIVAVTSAFSHWIIASNIPQGLVRYITSTGLEAWHFLLVMNLVMMAMGMLLEVVAVILITLPIVLPALDALGIDLVHYGIVVIVNMGLATITPPVGLNLFVLQSISSVPFGQVMRGIWPFIGLLLLLLVGVTFVPGLSLWLPGLLYG